MNYHNRQLRNELDATLRLRVDAQKQNLSVGEYSPLLLLIILLASLLMNGLAG